jgi:hydroxyacylglutathione hydrolase
MGDLYGFAFEPAPPLDKHISHNEVLSFGHSKIRAIHVPGHSQGSLAFYSESDAFLISGDAFFAGSIGRTDLPGGDYDTLISSIQNNLFSLPENTTVWPGHGASTTILEEKKYNPFFNDYKT